MLQRAIGGSNRGDGKASTNVGTQLRTMGGESWLMVDFALRWWPFGGPRPDDIWVEFGISMLTFAQRIDEFLKGAQAADLSLPERNALRKIVAVVERSAERQ